MLPVALRMAFPKANVTVSAPAAAAAACCMSTSRDHDMGAHENQLGCSVGMRGAYHVTERTAHCRGLQPPKRMPMHTSPALTANHAMREPSHATTRNHHIHSALTMPGPQRLLPRHWVGLCQHVPVPHGRPRCGPGVHGVCDQRLCAGGCSRGYGWCHARRSKKRAGQASGI